MANVLTDIEPLYYMLTEQYPIHRFFHSYLGGTVTVFLTILLFVSARRVSKVVRLPNILEWQGLNFWPIVTGAALGTYSHIFLDSIMHSDMEPYAPLNDQNQLFGAIDMDLLQMLCAGAGIVGGILAAVKHLSKNRNAPNE